MGWEDYFPYEIRDYQDKVMDFIQNSKEKFLLLQAPTGFGKTITVLSSLMDDVLLGKRIVWCVRTGNESNRPIEELFEIERKTGKVFIGISIRGKRDMCMMKEKFKVKTNEEVQELCKRIRKNCVYYKRYLNLRGIELKTLRFSDIKRIGEELKICPYYFQLDIAREASIISLNYNYVFTPLRKILRVLGIKNDILVVDEAHNIYDFVIKSYSDRITKNTIKRALNEMKGVNYHGIWLKILVKFDETMERISRRGETELDFHLIENVIEDGDLDEMEDIVDKIIKAKINKGISPRSSLNHLLKFFRKVTSEKGDGKYLVLQREKNIWILNYLDFDVKEKIKRVWDMFDKIILMSGTLEPVDQLINTLGIEDYAFLKVPSFADTCRVLSTILVDVSTKGEEVEERFVENYKKSFLEVLKWEYNTGIFFPSYRVMEIFKDFIKETGKKFGKNLYFEREDMSGDEASEILEKMKNKNSVLIGVCGGRFSEGVDFPGEVMEVIYVVGIPFDKPDLIVKKRIEYSEKVYGKKGRYYSYIIPALRKVSQTIGRIIRSKEDFGLIILGDFRYTRREYLNLLPDFVKYNITLSRSNKLNLIFEKFKEIKHTLRSRDIQP